MAASPPPLPPPSPPPRLRSPLDRLPLELLGACLRALSFVELVGVRRVSRAFLREADVLLAELTSLDLRVVHGEAALVAACDFVLSRARSRTLGRIHSLMLQGTVSADVAQPLVHALAPSLTALHIESKRLLPHAVDDLLSPCRSLEQLTLAHCERLDDDAMAALARRCGWPAVAGEGLRRLDLSAVHRLTDRGVEALVPALQRLSALDLSMCFHLSDDALRALARLPSLSDLRLGRCLKLTDEGLAAFAEGRCALRERGACAPLRVLDLHSCFKLSSLGIDALVSREAAAAPQSLRILRLGGVPGVHDSTLRLLANVATESLEELDVTGAARVGADGLFALRHCRALRALWLTRVDSLSDESLGSLCRNLLRLELLAVRSTALSDEGVAALALLPRLRVVDLADVYGLTHEGMGHLLLPRSPIEFINVQNCALLTPASFELLASRCASLRVVVLGGVFDSDVTTRVVARMRRRHPNLQVFLFKAGHERPPMGA